MEIIPPDGMSYITIKFKGSNSTPTTTSTSTKILIS